MKILKHIIPVFLVLFFIIFSASAQKGYMKIGDIKGEATDKGHNEWISISGFKQSMATPAGGTGAARRRGSVSIQDIIVSKGLDKSSPLLMEKCAKGELIPEMIIDIADIEGKIMYSVRLKNVRISGVSNQAECNPQCKIMEELAVNFSEITWEYTENNKGKISTTWKIETAN